MDARPKTSSMASDLAHDIDDNHWLNWTGGLVAIVLGGLAVLLPHIATIATELVIGAILLVGGVVECVTSFKSARTSRKAQRFVVGLLGIAAGALLIVFPLLGVIALTLVLTGFFLASGVFKLYFAWKTHPSTGWGWMVASGLLAIALGALVWSGLPGTAFWVLGFIVGIDMIFYGTSLLATAIAARRSDDKSMRPSTNSQT